MVQMFHVYKTYGDTPALIDINLRVRRGDFIFLTGPSGAGKTSLLKLIFCEERPTEGQILVDGRNIARLKSSSIPYLRRNIGVVFQDFRLLMNKTVFENISLPLRIRAIKKREQKRRAWEALKMVNLQHRMNHIPEKISGGEQQRAAFARAVVNEPLLLLADEPTGNLDDRIAVIIIGLMEQINARGTTVMLATHDRWLLKKFPRRTVVLDKGRIVYDK